MGGRIRDKNHQMWSNALPANDSNDSKRLADLSGFRGFGINGTKNRHKDYFSLSKGSLSGRSSPRRTASPGLSWSSKRVFQEKVSGAQRQRPA